MVVESCASFDIRSVEDGIIVNDGNNMTLARIANFGLLEITA